MFDELPACSSSLHERKCFRSFSPPLSSHENHDKFFLFSKNTIPQVISNSHQHYSLRFSICSHLCFPTPYPRTLPATFFRLFSQKISALPFPFLRCLSLPVYLALSISLFLSPLPLTLFIIFLHLITHFTRGKEALARSLTFIHF